MASSRETSPERVPKRRYHSVSPFYLYCKEFVEECRRNDRHFRTDKQGFEAAALKWNALSAAEKQLWREKVRAEKVKCAEEGNKTKLKMRNGDRGDTNCDPTDLGLLKDLTLKQKRDVAALINRWTWQYSADKEGIAMEHFLVVSAKVDGSGDFTALAVVEFSLADGIIDEYHASFGQNFPGSVTNARYVAIRRALNWPSKIKRELGDMAPKFFAARGQLSHAFDTLTFVDPKNGQWGSSSGQLSLAKDLANASDLANALRSWFGKPQLKGKDDLEITAEKLDCLAAARQEVGNILNEFSYLQGLSSEFAVASWTFGFCLHLFCTKHLAMH